MKLTCVIVGVGVGLACVEPRFHFIHELYENGMSRVECGRVHVVIRILLTIWNSLDS